jgi:hypothetical protein
MGTLDTSSTGRVAAIIEYIMGNPTTTIPNIRNI